MGDRAAGPLHWGEEERRLVDQYLRDGRLDPTRIKSSTYLRSVKRREALWDRHPGKNFNQNVRRQVLQWQTDRKRDGGRRSNGSESEVSSGDEFGGATSENDAAPTRRPSLRPSTPVSGEFLFVSILLLNSSNHLFSWEILPCCLSEPRASGT